MNKNTKATFLRKVVSLTDHVLHQFSRLFYWVRPLPERALALASWYMFPLVVLTEIRPFRQLPGLSLTFVLLVWIYFLGVVAFATVAIQARNETWRGLATGEYTLDMIEAIAGTNDHKAR